MATVEHAKPVHLEAAQVLLSTLKKLATLSWADGGEMYRRGRRKTSPYALVDVALTKALVQLCNGDTQRAERLRIYAVNGMPITAALEHLAKMDRRPLKSMNEAAAIAAQMLTEQGWTQGNAGTGNPEDWKHPADNQVARVVYVPAYSDGTDLIRAVRLIYPDTPDGGGPDSTQLIEF